MVPIGHGPWNIRETPIHINKIWFEGKWGASLIEKLGLGAGGPDPYYEIGFGESGLDTYRYVYTRNAPGVLKWTLKGWASPLSGNLIF